MQNRFGLLVSDMMPIYMIMPRYSHNYSLFYLLLDSNSFTHHNTYALEHPIRFAHAHEDRDHLFFTCQFSTRVWNYLNIQWLAGLTTAQCLFAARKSFGKPFFREVVYLAAWNIWLLRNGRIFRHERPSFAAWKRNFIHDVTLHSHRFKPSLKPLLLAWVHSLP